MCSAVESPKNEPNPPAGVTGRALTAQGNYSSLFYWFKPACRRGRYSWCASQLLRTIHSSASSRTSATSCLFSLASPAGRLSVRTHFRCFVHYCFVQRYDLINNFSLEEHFEIQNTLFEIRSSKNESKTLNTLLKLHWCKIKKIYPHKGIALNKN